MHVSRRMALHGLNISIAVFTAISAYGLFGFLGIGAEAAAPPALRETLLIAAGIAASIAGICFFGIQLDRRKVEDRRAEEQLKAEEAARKGGRRPTRPS